MDLPLSLRASSCPSFVLLVLNVCHVGAGMLSQNVFHSGSPLPAVELAGLGIISFFRVIACLKFVSAALDLFALDSALTVRQLARVMSTTMIMGMVWLSTLLFPIDLVQPSFKLPSQTFVCLGVITTTLDAPRFRPAMAAIDFVNIESSSTLQSCSCSGAALLASDLTKVEILLPPRAMSCLGFTLVMLDVAHVGTSSLLQQPVQPMLTLPISSISRLDLSFFACDVVSTDSTMSLRMFM